MAILDLQALLSDDQAITTDAASTNIFDWGAPGTVVFAAAARARDLGKSLIPVFCRVTADFAGGTNLIVTLEADNDVSFGSATTLWTSETIVTATLVAGYDFALKTVPFHATERYMRFNYNQTGTFTAGTITAGLGTWPDTNRS